MSEERHKHVKQEQEIDIWHINLAHKLKKSLEAPRVCKQRDIERYIDKKRHIHGTRQPHTKQIHTHTNNKYTLAQQPIHTHRTINTLRPYLGAGGTLLLARVLLAVRGGPRLKRGRTLGARLREISEEAHKESIIGIENPKKTIKPDTLELECGLLRVGKTEGFGCQLIVLQFLVSVLI